MSLKIWSGVLSNPSGEASTSFPLKSVHWYAGLINSIPGFAAEVVHLNGPDLQLFHVNLIPREEDHYNFCSVFFSLENDIILIENYVSRHNINN